MEKMKKILKYILIAAAAITAAVEVILNMTSCSTLHSVTQSVKISKDSVIVMKYQQSGSTIKK